MFTSLAGFITMALRMPAFLKPMLISVLLASLVAFGGRGGILFTVFGLLAIALSGYRHAFRTGLTMRRLIALIAASMLAPALLVGGLYVLLNTSMGERLM